MVSSSPYYRSLRQLNNNHPDTTAAQPAFLQRLRGRIAGDAPGGDPARHAVPIARNKRLAQDDEEDAPTYVLEGTDQSLTKAEYEALVSGKASTTEEGEGEKTEGDEKKETEKTEKEKDKPIVKKRKVAKVIGAEADEGDTSKELGKSDAKVVKKPKKKVTKVKLTFGDDEG